MKLIKIICAALCLFFVNADGMQELEKALIGKSEMQVMTLVRSCSNSMLFRAERAIIQNLLDNIINSKPLNDFTHYTATLTIDIKRYGEILDQLNDIRDKPGTILQILQSRFKESFTQLGVFLPTEDINGLASVLNAKTAWQKSDFEILGEKKESFWEILTEYDNSLVAITKDSFLQYKDADILKACFQQEDLALYQAIQDLKEELRNNRHDLYCEDADDFSNFLKNIITYYTEQWKNIGELYNKFARIYDQVVPYINMLVTNEYFWGKIPFNEDIIVPEFCDWSSRLNTTILCTNFLVKNDQQILAAEIKNKTAKMRLFFPEGTDFKTDPFKNQNRHRLLALMDSTIFGSGVVNTFDESCLGKYLLYLDKQYSVAGVIKNTSMIFFNKEHVTTYDKCTYFKEQESLLYNYIYEFGNGQDEIKTNHLDVSPIHRYVSTQICRDLTAGIRTEDKGKQRFHILQSNTIDFNCDAIPIGISYVVHANYGKPGAVYKRTPKFSSVQGENSYAWDPVGPFDFHINFKIGTSIYTLQRLTILPSDK